MNTVQIAIDAIHKMNNDELAQIIEAVKLQRTWISRTTARALNAGDTVEFAARGRVIRGTVVKVNRKNVKVKEDNAYTTWNVPASMLKMIDTA